MRESDRDRRKPTAKEAGIVLVKAGLYVRNGWFQLLIDDLGLEFLIDHGTNEIIEAEIVLLLAFFVERSLRVGCTFELGLKTAAVLIEKCTLLIRGGVGELIRIDEGCRALCRFAEMLQMSEFLSMRRILFVVPFVSLQIDFRITFLGEITVGTMQMFLASNELMSAIQCTRCQVNARGIMNFCHILNVLGLITICTG